MLPLSRLGSADFAEGAKPTTFDAGSVVDPW
jgi:hypothetical protein